ncbi:MAG: VOC family protein [Xanthomonadales bacterium]|nr:VOC family protein [Gammaproteobacteria bacterium]MBT8049924.1 VOC family protein [Gammaproteobacteria bacterium]MBT8056881.1 VOC family protein [Gammaproteobacteria bacterium]NNJ80056.1 VOC family protein [Xanthomonadales bacterium]NNL05086.1 VOC family protein [Xanthomonadales bacterium]
MHRSQLAGFIIDCRTGDIGEAAEFWSSALGLSSVADPRSDATRYRRLEPGPGGLELEVQRVDHESRVHLDIETDNVEAEVGRLEALGAKRVESVHSWVVMEAPTGQRFCVVRAFSKGFDDSARRWE